MIEIIRDPGYKIGRFLFVSAMTYENMGLNWKYDKTTSKYSVVMEYPIKIARLNLKYKVGFAEVYIGDAAIRSNNKM